MKYAFYAGAVVLAMIGSLAIIPAANAGDWSNNYSAQHPASASVDIVRIHSVLQLNQEQERYWRPVEAALRDLARHQERSENEGIVRRVSRRIVQIALDSAAVHRLAVAARPLIARLTDQQKQAAGQLAQEMGLGPVVMAALNQIFPVEAALRQPIDELSLGFAPVVVQQLVETFKALKAAGETILLVEQNLHLALAISDYAYVIAEGRSFAEGPSDAAKPEIRQAYLGL